MKSEQREKVLILRKNHQLGYGQIAKQVKVSKSTLSRWLRDFPLTEERILELRREGWSRGEAKRERFRQTMARKRQVREEKIYTARVRRFKKISRSGLYIAGLMLYAGEGDKKSRGEIAFSNSDPELVRFFSLWMQKFMDIPLQKTRAQLHLYENMDIPEEENFWKKALLLASSQLCKSQIRPIKAGGFSYREPFRHGTCKLYFDSTEKKTELMLSIKAFFGTYKGHLRV